MATPTASEPNVALHEWALPLIEGTADWTFVEGGRGAGRSTQLAVAALILASREPMRVLCVREQMKSLKQSFFQTLARVIKRVPGWDALYRLTAEGILGRNGSRFIFSGLSGSHATARSIRSIEDIRLAVVDEGQYISQESYEDFFPSIRESGARVLVGLNPRYSTDPLYRLAQSIDDPGVTTIRVSWRDNRYFSARADRDRLRFQETDPTRYDVIYEGALDDDGLGVRRLLSFAAVAAAVDLYEPPDEAVEHVISAGYDVSLGGNDWNVVAIRVGACITAMDRWRSTDIVYSTQRALHFAREHRATDLYYDAGGVGAGVTGALQTIEHDDVMCREVYFGPPVAGPSTYFTGTRTNKQEFSTRGAQLGWNLRLRMGSTLRLMEGADVDRADCIFLNPRLPHQSDLRAELVQVLWETGKQGEGKIKIVKGDPSPDRYDSIALACAGDSARGLVMGGKAFTMADLVAGMRERGVVG